MGLLIFMSISWQEKVCEPLDFSCVPLKMWPEIYTNPASWKRTKLNISWGLCFWFEGEKKPKHKTLKVRHNIENKTVSTWVIGLQLTITNQQYTTHCDEGTQFTLWALSDLSFTLEHQWTVYLPRDTLTCRLGTMGSMHQAGHLRICCYVSEGIVFVLSKNHLQTGYSFNTTFYLLQIHI